MLVCAAVWAAAVAISRTSSISSLTATTAAPVAAWLMGYPAVAAVMVVIALIVIFQHRANIARIRAGTEPRIGIKG